MNAAPVCPRARVSAVFSCRIFLHSVKGRSDCLIFYKKNQTSASKRIPVITSLYAEGYVMDALLHKQNRLLFSIGCALGIVTVLQ